MYPELWGDTYPTRKLVNERKNDCMHEGMNERMNEWIIAGMNACMNERESV